MRAESLNRYHSPASSSAGKNGKIDYYCQMAVTVPLDEMSLSEKLLLMETLWEDLTRRPDDLASPSWHKEVLEDCRRKAESGEEKFTDWEAAKREIRSKAL